MRLIIFLLSLNASLIGYAQQQKGINFQSNLTWEQAKVKAKKESKFIFLDCYATWCVPCKLMDKNTYPNDTLGELMNEKFISLKVQFDSTKNDNEEVRNWYQDIREIQEKYQVSSFPSLLFFTSEGNLIYRDVGYKNVTKFIELVNVAIESTTLNLYDLLDNYRRGEKNYPLMAKLVRFSRDLAGDRELSNTIAYDYKHNYLDRLSNKELLTREVLEFIQSNIYLVNSSNDRFFQLFYQQRQDVDSILNNPRYALNIVNGIINREEIEEKIWHDNKLFLQNPDWQGMLNEITRKYNNIDGKNLVRDAQLSFYKRTYNWRKFTALFEEKVREIPPRLGGKVFDPNFGDAWGLNVESWDVFLHCNEHQVLRKAVKWIDKAIDIIKAESPNNPNSQVFDTKANLLYKLGKVKEAIRWEQKAIDIVAKRNQNKDKKSAEEVELIKILTKMKNGEPTWPVK